MRVELQRELDAHATAYLRLHGIDEPLRWSPTSEINLQWPGTDIEEIDIDKMHGMLLGGTTSLRTLSEELSTSVPRLLRAIDAHPPSANTARDPIDWTSKLRHRPTANRRTT